MKNNIRSKHFSTNLNHPPKVELKPENTPLVSPIYQSAKFDIADNIPYTEQFIYSRLSNPTTRELELTLAEIQKTEDCITVSSGLGAITGTLLALLKSGDHLITFREIYKPARTFIREILPNFGITASVLTVLDLSHVEQAIIPGKTKIIYFETPTNPNLSIVDIGRLKEIAVKNNLLLVMDGTLAGLHQHTEMGIDLVIHSLTKFANGHGDVIAGCVSGSKKLITLVRGMLWSLGNGLDPHSAFLIQRGLRTYELRYHRQCESALKIANFLSAHPAIKKVYYPGLKTHPDYQLAQKQMKDMGAIVSFEFFPHICESAIAFCYRMKLFHFASSIGSTDSLINPTMTFFGDDLSATDKAEMGLNPYSVRLSIGLEHEEDLIDDLKSALL